MATPIRVLGISGSLRDASNNTGLIRAAAQVAPAPLVIEPFDLSRIPLYNADLDASDPPSGVIELRQRIADADALLIATPEYNYSVPGVLKNALDWASRPRNTQPMIGKPAAFMGAGGRFGTVRAQAHLRYIAVELQMLVMPKPELMIIGAHEKFNAQGNLTHEPTRDELRAFLEAFAAWIERVRA